MATWETVGVAHVATATAYAPDGPMGFSGPGSLASGQRLSDRTEGSRGVRRGVWSPEQDGCGGPQGHRWRVCALCICHAVAPRGRALCGALIRDPTCSCNFWVTAVPSLSVVGTPRPGLFLPPWLEGPPGDVPCSLSELRSVLPGILPAPAQPPPRPARAGLPLCGVPLVAFLSLATLHPDCQTA